MESATHHSKDVRQVATGPAFVSLDRETRAAVETACAAFHLSRQPQTLRGWASADSGPLRALRINNRLAWPVAELKRVLGLA